MFTASRQMEDEIERQAGAVASEVKGIERSLYEQLRRAVVDRAVDAIFEELFLHQNSNFALAIKKLLNTPPPTTQSTIHHTRQELHAAFAPILGKSVVGVNSAVGTAFLALEGFVTGVLLPRLAEAHTNLMNTEMRSMFEQLRLRVDFVNAMEGRELEVGGAAKESLERERQLHATVDGLQQEAASRITEKQEAVEEIRRRMSQLSEDATAELRRVVAELTSECEATKLELRKVEQDRLHLTQLAHCFDELCGKLNEQVLALRAFIVDRGVVCEELMSLDEMLARLHTTLGCRGTPLTVGGGWVVGDVPDTIGRLNLLCGTDIPPASCSLEQHKLLDGVIKAVELRQHNAKLMQRVAFLEKQLEVAEVAGFKMRMECEQEKRRSANQAADKLRKLLDENAALRAIVSMSAPSAASASSSSAPRSVLMSSQAPCDVKVKQLECEVFELKRKLADRQEKAPDSSSSILLRQLPGPQDFRVPGDAYQPQLRAAVASLSRRAPRPPSTARPSTAATNK
jgi:hypothetical protein